MLGLVLALALSADVNGTPETWSVSSPDRRITLHRATDMQLSPSELAALDARLSPLREKANGKKPMAPEEARLLRVLTARRKAEIGPRLVLTDAKGKRRWTIDAWDLPYGNAIVTDAGAIVLWDALPEKPVIGPVVAILDGAGTVLRTFGLEDLVGKGAEVDEVGGHLYWAYGFTVAGGVATVQLKSGGLKAIDLKTGAFLP